MHNLKDIRKNLEHFKKKLSNRKSDINFDILIKLDKENREIIQNKEKLEQEKKLISKKRNIRARKKVFIQDKKRREFWKIKKNFWGVR